MRILVQKFGGTSLSTDEGRHHAVRHVKRAMAQQYKLVIVVSAMGRLGEPYATDTLLQWIRDHGDALPVRETDLLLSCGEIISASTFCSLLQADGIPASVLTGGQAGILTNGDYGNAHIVDIRPRRIMELLEQDRVVIVTGFQGKTAEEDVTTLGRGGSDTTAAALGAALQAEEVEIFTDVGGIMTADPRIVEEAAPLEHVGYSEICHMAYHGAKVIHPRAVEIAMQAGVPVRVRSTFSDEGGTLVSNGESTGSRSVQDRFVTGIAHTANISQIQIHAEKGQFDLQLNVFKAMANHRISVDFINVNPSGVVYTVFDQQIEKAIEILRSSGYEPHVLKHCAKVAVIGGGMNGVPGIMARIVEALTNEDIEILQSADSNTTIWVLVRNEHMVQAIQALHRTFELDKAHQS